MNKSEREDNTGIPEHWYVDAFGPLYPLIYAHRTVAAAAPEVRFACDAVSLNPDDVVLDLCCGSGRHLVTLGNAGNPLVGIDFSPELLALARKHVDRNTSLVRADMRRLPFLTSFDVVFSFFTSFGYFLDDIDNFKSAGELARVLKPGGRFFVDYLNPQHVEDTLKPESVRFAGDLTILERRWIDHVRCRVNKQVEIRRDEKSVGSTCESVRLYSLSEMNTLFLHAGLEVRRCWGDYSGAPYGKDSPRMILTGVRFQS